jgi:hypothetical protein
VTAAVVLPLSSRLKRRPNAPGLISDPVNGYGYGKTGHRTVGSFYTTLLHAIGTPQDTFGFLDPDLNETMQKGPCRELLA